MPRARRGWPVTWLTIRHWASQPLVRFYPQSSLIANGKAVNRGLLFVFLDRAAKCVKLSAQGIRGAHT